MACMLPGMTHARSPISDVLTAIAKEGAGFLGELIGAAGDYGKARLNGMPPGPAMAQTNGELAGRIGGLLFGAAIGHQVGKVTTLGPLATLGGAVVGQYWGAKAGGFFGRELHINRQLAAQLDQERRRAIASSLQVIEQRMRHCVQRGDPESLCASLANFDAVIVPARQRIRKINRAACLSAQQKVGGGHCN